MCGTHSRDFVRIIVRPQGWSPTNYQEFMQSQGWKVLSDISIEDLEEKLFVPLKRTAKPFLKTERYAISELQ